MHSFKVYAAELRETTEKSSRPVLSRPAILRNVACFFVPCEALIDARAGARALGQPKSPPMLSRISPLLFSSFPVRLKNLFGVSFCPVPSLPAAGFWEFSRFLPPRGGTGLVPRPAELWYAELLPSFHTIYFETTFSETRSERECWSGKVKKDRGE